MSVWRILVLLGLVIGAMATAIGRSGAEFGVSTTPPVYCAFGCYIPADEITEANWQANIKLMKQYGMDTFALMDVRSAERLAFILDTAIEEGMLNSAAPIFLCISGGEPYYRTLFTEEEWERAAKKYTALPTDSGAAWYDFEGSARTVERARKIGKYGTQYPEFIFYTIDEPGRGEAIPEGAPIFACLREWTMIWNFLGYRCGTAVCNPNVKNMVPVLDVLAVNIIIGGDLLGCKNAIMLGWKEFWVYDIDGAATTPEMTRYHFGLWMWLVQPRVSLTWCWRAFVGNMDEPKPTPQLEAYGKGVEDYKWLTATEARLKQYRDTFDWEGYPMKEWVEQGGRATTKPSIDFEKLLPAREEE